MVIEKNEEWGRAGVLPPDAPVLDSDRRAAELAAAAARSDADAPIVALVAGDLARTLGLRGPVDGSAPKQLLPVDALVVELDDGAQHWAMAHVLAGSPLLVRSCTALMNAAFVGRLNLAPRAHPGDGTIDVVDFDLRFADRVKARRRMPTGTHVPHPDITVRRRRQATIELARRRRIAVDGRIVGRSSTLAFHVAPGALIVAV